VTQGIVKENLRENSNLLPKALDELMVLLTEVLRQNYFKLVSRWPSDQGRGLNSDVVGSRPGAT
jgi:hypothetical protein